MFTAFALSRLLRMLRMRLLSRNSAFHPGRVPEDVFVVWGWISVIKRCYTVALAVAPGNLLQLLSRRCVACLKIFAAFARQVFAEAPAVVGLAAHLLGTTIDLIAAGSTELQLVAWL
jgi:hypothetical protein